MRRGEPAGGGRGVGDARRGRGLVAGLGPVEHLDADADGVEHADALGPVELEVRENNMMFFTQSTAMRHMTVTRWGLKDPEVKWNCHLR